MNDGQTGDSSVGLIAERFGPVVVAVIGFFANVVWLRFDLMAHAEWSNRLIDRVIQATSVSAAFWGVAITLLIGMQFQPILITIKRLGYFRLLVRYLSETLFASVWLLLLSVLFEPLSKRFSPIILSSLWLGLGIWALLTALRSYSALIKLLARMN
jgi:hypothetical protein